MLLTQRFGELCSHFVSRSSGQLADVWHRKLNTFSHFRNTANTKCSQADKILQFWWSRLFWMLCSCAKHHVSMSSLFACRSFKTRLSNSTIPPNTHRPAPPYRKQSTGTWMGKKFMKASIKLMVLQGEAKRGTTIE